MSLAEVIGGLNPFKLFLEWRQDRESVRPEIRLSLAWIGVQEGTLDNTQITIENLGKGSAKDVRILLDGVEVIHIPLLTAGKFESPITFYASESQREKARQKFLSKQARIGLQIEFEDIRGKFYSQEDHLVKNRFESSETIYILERDAK